MLTAVFIVFVVLLAALLFIAARKPDSFRVQRSLNVNAPTDKIFPLVDDFHQWPAWSPWEKVDPQVKRVFSGAERGKGAMYDWSGNKKLGIGHMEILESTPPVKIKIKIHFIKPIAAQNEIEFTFVPQGESTVVTQAMYGQNSFLSKVMGIFFSMDEMIGQKFEEGLSSIKSLAEK